MFDIVNFKMELRELLSRYDATIQIEFNDFSSYQFIVYNQEDMMKDYTLTLGITLDASDII